MKECYVILLAFSFLVIAKADLPLDGVREINITTDEATWLAVDVSPTHDTLIIEVLGDLYTLPITGGEVTAITSGMEFDSQPVYSPDGSKIAFISDRGGKEDLWIMDANGENPRNLSDAKDDALFASPSWSPKGDHVIVSKSSWGLATYEIWAYHLNGGSGVQITYANKSAARSARHNALGAVYSPDGRYLYYARKYGGFGYDLRLPIWQVVRRELKNNYEDTLTGSSGGAFRPQISNDGRYLAYGTRAEGQTGLRIRDLITGDDVWFEFPVQRDEQESRFTRDVFPNYSFTPDNTEIVFTMGGRLWRKSITDVFEDENSTAREIPFNVQINKQLGPRLYFPHRIGIEPVKARMIHDLELSPDKQKFVFTAMADIYVFDLETNDLWHVEDVPGFSAHPTWSPNSTQIAFVSWSADGGVLWTVPARENRKPTRVSSNSAFYTQPLWARDGNSIFVFRGIQHERVVDGGDFGQPPGTDIIEVSVTNRNLEDRVVRHARGFTNQHWGPDENRLYAYLYPGIFRSGNSGLVSIRLDGSDFRSHLTVKGSGIYYDEGEIPVRNLELSPNGRYVLVQHTNRLYLLRTLQTDLPSFETSINDPKLPYLTLVKTGVDHLGWSHDSSVVYWSVGNNIFYRSVADIEIAFDCLEQNDTTDEDCEDTLSNTADESETESIESSSLVQIPVKIYHARQIPKGSIALVGGTVSSMTSEANNQLRNTTVLIEGDRIKAIGVDIEIPQEATIVDVSGTYIFPGYVDTHAHFKMYRNVLDPDLWSLRANLAYGITTATDVQPSTVDVIDYGDLVNAGRMKGPRTLSTGPGVFSDHDFESQEHAKRVLQNYVENYGVRHIKAYISGNRKQRQWLLQAAAELKVMPTAEGALDTKLDLTHVIDGFSGNEHSLPVIGMYKDVVELIAQSQIAYTPTLLVVYGGPRGENYFIAEESPLLNEKLRDFTPQQILDSKLRRSFWVHEEDHVFLLQAEQSHRIVQAGGKVGVGSHGQLQGLGYHWELWSLAKGGFSNYEAMRAATRHGAEMLGIAEDIGTIEVGKLADLVVLENDPLENIRSSDDLVYVIKGGVVYDAETLEEVHPAGEE
ncbi:MAG: amidohydrolase family protein [Gammaproteobacteria bacterium]|nr:amidohydrolase family protein [Gammaproteobacteria bacterium]MYI77604.1 amidohydrolase family protein [Gammaproteobacteria bacterium]